MYVKTQNTVVGVSVSSIIDGREMFFYSIEVGALPNNDDIANLAQFLASFPIMRESTIVAHFKYHKDLTTYVCRLPNKPTLLAADLIGRQTVDETYFVPEEELTGEEEVLAEFR